MTSTAEQPLVVTDVHDRGGEQLVPQMGPGTHMHAYIYELRRTHAHIHEITFSTIVQGQVCRTGRGR